jgi:hypothetical protein
MGADVLYACLPITPSAANWLKNGLPPWEVDMLAPITHILPLTTIVRKRLLPVDGRVIAKLGQKVNPTDVVAEAVIGHKHLIVDVAKLLNVSPRRAAGLIKAKKGNQIGKGEVIAESTGFFAREAISPNDGRVVAVGGGKLVLETEGSSFELAAGIPGVITEVIGERGVVIRSTGSVIQGLWGNGRLETGVMVSVMDSADEVFDANRLDISIRGSIVLGGFTEDPNVIKSAIELPARGLILASMSPALLPVAMQAPFPIILIDGFGRRPMNSVAYKLLSTNIKRDVALNAEVYDRLNGTRPEVFIPLPVSHEPPELREVETFAPGQVVRVIRLIAPSQVGTLEQLLTNPATLASGLKAKAAEVRLENGKVIVVPLTNLEVLG